MKRSRHTKCTGINQNKSGTGIVKIEQADMLTELRTYTIDNSKYGIEEPIYDNPYFGKGTVNEDQTNH